MSVSPSTDTIVAIATPPGRGGVGILRLSGSLAFSIAQQLSNKVVIKPRYAHYASFYDDHQTTCIDQGVLIYFKAPHSFTGEDVIEIQGHGAPVVMDQLLQRCITLGARMAHPGEFSERAFLNDKMDLTQAEAIADLIAASSKTAAAMAMRSLQGDFSKRIHVLNEQLIHLRLYVEAAIDFPEEEIDFLNDGHVLTLLDQNTAALAELRSQAQQGLILREGLTLVIVGRPNVGKSTLINTFAGQEVAIVTDIAGTTRDVRKESILLDDIPLHVVDTAGLRQSDDPVEQEGIKRAWDALKKADVLLFMMDATTNDKEDVTLEEDIKVHLPTDIPLLRVVNKIDCLSFTAKQQDQTVYLSLKTGEGLSLLKSLIKKSVGYHPVEGQFMARRRHLHALDKAYDLLIHGKTQLQYHRAGELLAEDLRLAHIALCEITGEFTSDDLLGRIFSSFCIGK